MLQLSSAGKRFGQKLLFEDANWLITPDERTGLVGGNGTGKSTLLKILGGIETLGLLANQFQLQGAFWNTISGLNDNFGALGYGIVALFIVSWGTSFLVYRFKRYDLHVGLD